MWVGDHACLDGLFGDGEWVGDGRPMRTGEWGFWNEGAQLELSCRWHRCTVLQMRDIKNENVQSQM